MLLLSTDEILWMPYTTTKQKIIKNLVCRKWNWYKLKLNNHEWKSNQCLNSVFLAYDGRTMQARIININESSCFSWSHSAHICLMIVLCCHRKQLSLVILIQICIHQFHDLSFFSFFLPEIFQRTQQHRKKFPGCLLFVFFPLLCSVAVWSTTEMPMIFLQCTYNISIYAVRI